MLLLLVSPALGQEAAAAPRPLITQAVDESQLAPLKGNTHPLARPEFDAGAAPASLPMERMLLVLKRSPAQEFALRTLLDNQQDKHSPSYHQWLTPEQFGEQFGPTDADMQTITVWLQSHGFQVGTTKGRTVLEFSGSASQVQEAFHTSIHSYIVNGEQHWANASDPSIPTALVPAVAGVLTLHNFLKKPQYVLSKEKGIITPGKPPQVTFTNGDHALAPGDYAVIYNISPVYSAGINGNGVTIGVVARSDFVIGDYQEFVGLLQLSANTPQFIWNGPDPGDLYNGDDVEGTLDATWSQAIAPGATVDYVVSASTDTADGVDLSEAFIIENNLANVMTESFSTCEALATNAQITGTASLAEQAAAQGITYLVSTGDSGAEGCDNPNHETSATGPISINLLASSPFTVGVGGTVFNEHGSSTYWNTTTTQGADGMVSALSYIPEDVWNNSCVSCSTPNILAGGGGASLGNTYSGGTFTGFPVPSWQTGVTGLPTPTNPNQRHLPDVSLTAAEHDPYLLCYTPDGYPCSEGYVHLVSGTSASAPSFAGIMALVNQKMGMRQGQAGYVLYPLAAAGNSNLSECNGSSTTTAPASTCTFNDVTVGNNEVPGEAGYPSAPYSSTTGYDPASGLGSVNVANLVNGWANANFRATTTTLSLGQTTNIAHGTAVNVTIGVTASSGTPSGDVSLIAQTGSSPSAQTDAGFFTLSSGSASGTTSTLPGGSYKVIAHYEGASANGAFFGGSDSNTVAVTVNPEGSTTTLICEPGTVLLSNCAVTFDANGNFIALSNNATIPYGDLVYLHAQVKGASGNGVPTGTVNFFDSTVPVTGNPYPLSSDGSTVTSSGLYNLPGGFTSITATYNGDSSFNSSPSAPLNFNITLAATGLTVTPSPTSTNSGSSVALTANFTVGTATLPSYGNAPTGTVTFYSGTTQLGTPVPVSGNAGYGNVESGNFVAATISATGLTTTALPIGQNSITAVYSGDGNYAAATSPAVVVTVSPPDFSLSAPQVTVSQGSSTTVAVTVNPLGNFTGVVGGFTCSGLPAETTCDNGNPTTVTGSGSTTITITTTPLGQMQRPIFRGRGIRHIATAMLPLLPLFGLCLIGIPVWRRRRGALPLLMMIALALTLPSCGGGGQSVVPNPVPSISSLSPTQQAAGSQVQMLTINGTGFIGPSTVTYNGTAHASTYQGATELTIVLGTSDLAKTGNFPVVVTNPSPGGGSSSPSNFAVVTGTPTGTFTVTVTATSGTLSHTTTFNLVVQ